jgi:hypothetical protein
MYGSYGQIREFFSAMKRISDQAPEKQLDFFISEFNNSGLLSQFEKWLQGLHDLILEVKEFRGFAFELYRILDQLAIVIVCIQKEDFDVAKIPMEKGFFLVEQHASDWAAMKVSGEFGRLETQLMLVIGKNIQAALVQTQQNGEASAKPKYLSQLKKIVAIL